MGTHVDRILELSEIVFGLRKRRETAARALADIDDELDEAIGELARYQPVQPSSDRSSSAIADRKRFGSQPGSLGYRIIERIRDSSVPLSGAELSAALHADSKQVATILTRMVQNGQLARLGRGQYTLPQTELNM